VRVVAVIDSSGYVFDPGGLSPRRLASLTSSKESGVSLAEARGGVRASAQEALDEVARHALSRPILVDVTAGDTSAMLETALHAGMDIVLANKKPLAAPRGAKGRGGLARSAASRGRRLLHEATVGAGLPIIDTIQKLQESGDEILSIEGCPSGTLGYLFGELGRGTLFSTALRAAMKVGYTEPDPREDLSGMDVARKALILGQLLGFEGELDAVQVESLVPEDFRDMPASEFVERLEEMDPVWRERVEKARAADTVLRYRATVSPTSVHVGLVGVGLGSSFATLTGTDNQFAITTSRYRTNPIVITGPGAGVAVTAAGVLNDVLKLAGSR
jgi:aspartokinase/homoserine dehydrogenase 1